MTHRNITCLCLIVAAALSLLLPGCGKREEKKPQPGVKSAEPSPPPPSYTDRLKTLAAEALDTVRAEAAFDEEAFARARSPARRLRMYEYDRTRHIPRTSATLPEEDEMYMSPFLTPKALPDDENLSEIVRKVVDIGRPAVPALLSEFLETADVRSQECLLLPLGRIPDGRDLFLPFILEVLENGRQSSLRQTAVQTIQALLLSGVDPETLAPEVVPELLAISQRTRQSGTAQAALSQVYEFQMRGCALDDGHTAMLKEGLKDADVTDLRAVLAARCLLAEKEEAAADFLLLTLDAAYGQMVREKSRGRDLTLWTLHLFGEMRVAAAQEAVTKLLKAAAHAEARQKAAWALGRMAANGDEKAGILKALGDALIKERDLSAFKEIAEALSENGDEGAFRLLLRQSHDNEEELPRLYCIDALASALEAGGVPDGVAAEFIADCASRARESRDSSLRLRCVTALGAASTMEDRDLQDNVAAELVGIMNHDGEFWVRAEAAAALGRFSGPVTDLLEALQKDDVEHVRLSVIRALGERGSAEAAVPLIEAMKRDGHGIVTACAAALPRLEGFTPDCLFREYRSPGISEGARKNILMCLRGMRYEDEILGFLIDEALPGERDAERRTGIVLDIGSRLDSEHRLTPQAVARLVKLLEKESDTETVRAIIGVLGKLRAVEAVAGVIGAARRNAGVIPDAVGALRRIGDPRALDFFLEILSKVTFDNYRIYRAQAEAIAWAVQSFDRTAVSTRLRQVGTDRDEDPDVRRAALTLSYVIDDPGSKDDWDVGAYLLKTAEDEGEPTPARSGAMVGLALRKHRGAVTSLTGLLRSDDDEIARSAAFALGTIGDKQAFVPLLDMLKVLREGPPERESLKNMTIDALEKLTGEHYGSNIHAWEKWFTRHMREAEERHD